MDFVAVVEHRLILARVVSGPRLVGRGRPRSGRQPLRTLPTLDMLGLGSLVLGVHLSLCPPLRLLSSSAFLIVDVL